MTLTHEQALQVAGPLSNPSKMPCPSWGINPKHCKNGARLRKQKGTTCSICYACRGHYVYPIVRQRQQERLEGITHPLWVDAMIVLIKHSCTTHFRWFDSGDLQSSAHLLKIILIAIQLPDIKFWLPTQEHKLIQSFVISIPNNLTIRLTNAVIDPRHELNTALPVAEVRSCPKEHWPSGDTQHGWHCPAEISKSCNDCRACWDKRIKKVVYRRK